MATDWIPFPLTAPIGGLDFSKPENLLGHVYTQDMENSIIADGVVLNRPGYTTIGTFPSALPVMEGVEFGDDSGSLHNVFITTQNIVELTTPTTWSAKTGNNFTGDETNPIFAAPVGGLSTESLYITNGTDTMRVWTGSGNWSVLTTTGFTTLKAGCLIGFKGHLVLGDTTEDGDVFPYRIRWSTSGNPTTWNTVSAGFANLIEDQNNSKVMCMHPFGNNLVVYKEDCIYLLTYQGDPNYFVGRMMIADRGTISRKAVAPFGDAHLVVTKDNIHIFNGNGFIRPAIGEKIKKDFFDRLNWDARGTVHAKTFSSRFEVWIFFPEGADTSPQSAYCWNYKDNTWTYHTFSEDIYSSMEFVQAFSQIQPLVGLDTDVAKFMEGTDDDGTAISSHWRTKLHDYRELNDRLAIRNKTAARAEWDIATASPNPKVQVGVTNTLLGTITYETAQTIVNGDNSIKKSDHRSTGRFLTWKMTNDSGSASFNVAQFIPYLEIREANR